MRRLMFLASIVLLATTTQAALPNPIAQYEFEGNYAPTFGTVTGTSMTWQGFTDEAALDVGHATYGGHLLGQVADMSSGSGEGWIALTNDDIDAITTTFTVMCWAKYDGTNWSEGIVTRGYDWQLYANTGDNAAFQVADTTPISKVITPSFATNTWVHLAGTYDGQYSRMYLNGQLVDTQEVVGPILKGGLPFIIGGRSNGSGGMTEGFEGWIDDVRIYDVVVTQEDLWWASGVPEPATIALFGFGGLLLRRRKQK